MSGNIDNQFQVPITGSFTAVSQNKDLTSPNSGTSVIQLTGTWSGTLILEGSNDGTNYVTLQVMSSSTFLFSNSITSNGIYIANTNGYQFVRLRSSSWSSGTAVLSAFGSDSTSIDYTLSFLRGATDGTLIGNNGDRLKTDVTGTVTDGLSGGGLQGNLSVPTANTPVEVKVGAFRLSNRKLVTFQATDSDFYWGYSSSVTTSNGTLINKGSTGKWSIDPTAGVQTQIWVVCASSSKNGRVTESP